MTWRVYVIVEPLTGRIFALEVLPHICTAAWGDFFCHFNCFGFNCQHKVFLLKKGCFIFRLYVKGFCFLAFALQKHWILSFFKKSWNQTISCMFLFTLTVHLFLVFQVPLTDPPLQHLCGTDDLIYFLAFFLPSAFLLYLSPSFLFHLWKKACSKSSLALAHHKLLCRCLRKCLPAATIIKSLQQDTNPLDQAVKD